MTFLDSSVIIDYLDERPEVVEFVDDQDSLLTSSLCVFEVLQGEVHAPGQSDCYGVRQDFGTVTALDFNETTALEAARMQDHLLDTGAAMAPVDLLVAATARSTGDRLAIADSDFDVEPVREFVDVVDLSN